MSQQVIMKEISKWRTHHLGHLGKDWYLVSLPGSPLACLIRPYGGGRVDHDQVTLDLIPKNPEWVEETSIMKRLQAKSELLKLIHDTCEVAKITDIYPGSYELADRRLRPKLHAVLTYARSMDNL